MQGFEFPLDAYCERLDFRDSLTAREETLRGLHRAQTQHIPFENLDPLTGRPVSLEPGDLVQKLIFKKRGGYCFELNGLFLLALQTLGFRMRSLVARVGLGDGLYGMRAHQLTLVEIGNHRWLADVGSSGNGLIEPLPLEPGVIVDQKLNRFRLMTDETYGYRLEHDIGDRWHVLCAFSLDPFLPADFRLLNYYTSTSPDSLFTKLPLCSMPTAEARLILFGNQLKIRNAAGRSIIPINTQEALRQAVGKYFGIDWPSEYALPQPLPAPREL